MAETQGGDSLPDETAAQAQQEESIADHTGATEVVDTQANVGDLPDASSSVELKVRMCGVCGEEPGKYKCSRCPVS